MSKVHCGSAVRFVPGASRSPYYCAPLECVVNFSEGLAVWRLYKQTKKQSADQQPHHPSIRNTPLRCLLHMHVDCVLAWTSSYHNPSKQPGVWRSIPTSTTSCMNAYMKSDLTSHLSLGHLAMHTLAPVITFNHCLQWLFTHLPRYFITMLCDLSTCFQIFGRAAAKSLFRFELWAFIASFTIPLH